MARQEILIDTKVEGLRSVERLTAEIESLGKTSTKASKQLDRVRAGADKTSRSAAQTADKMDDMATQFSKMGGVGGDLGGVFDALSVTMSGPLGAAIGATTIGIGALFAGFKLSQAVLTQTSESFLNIATRAEEAGRAMTDFEASISAANIRLEEANQSLGDSFDDLIVKGMGGAKFADAQAIVFNKLTDEIESTDQMLMGFGLRFAQTAIIVADNIDELDLRFGAGAEAAEAFSNNLDLVIQVHNNGVAALQVGGLGGLIDGIGAAATNAAGRFFDLADSIRSAVSEFSISGFFDKINKAIKGAKPKRRRRGGGGRRRKSAAERRQESALGLVDELAVPDEPFDPVEAAAARGIGVGDTSQIQINQLEDTARAAAQLNEELQRINIGNTAIATTLNTATAPALQMVAEGMIRVGEATVQAMGAFTAGVGTLASFGDAVLDMFSNLSAQIGSFFIRTGIGMAFISPGTGAGLIAAGLALQFLSGALGAKGSGNAGTGGRSSGGAQSGASGAVTREIQRSLRGPDAGGSVTNIEVIIAGRAIEPEMVSIIDDMARLRRSRAFGRMGV